MSAIGKAFKKVVKFVKKHWKKIVIAAAVVFTAGIATVGLAGFSAAAATAGGGIGGFLSAAGSTMVAGVASIGGTLGIGSGVTATTAGGAFAGSAAVANATAAGLSGATLGSGAAAGAIGIGPSAGAGAAAAAAPAATSSFGIPGLLPATTPGAVTTASGLSYGGGAGIAAAGEGGIASVVGGAANQVAGKIAPEASKGFLGLLTSQAGSSLLSAGIMGISSFMQAKAANAAAEAEEPNAYYGVALDGGKSMTPDDMRTANANAGYDPRSFDRKPHGTSGTATNGPIFGSA